MPSSIVCHSERSEESPPFMFCEELEEGTHPSSVDCHLEGSEGSPKFEGVNSTSSTLPH